MKIPNLLGLWMGNNSSISTANGGSDVMSGAINSNMPQLNGVGAMLSPGDSNYKGHFRDGDLILKAEESDLEDYQLLLGESETELNNSRNDLRGAKTYYKNIVKSSDNRTKIVQLHNQAKAVVTGNHLKQVQSAVALKTSQMRTAGGYLIEKDRLPIHQQRTNEKVQRMRQKLNNRNSRRM